MTANQQRFSPPFCHVEVTQAVRAEVVEGQQIDRTHGLPAGVEAHVAVVVGAAADAAGGCAGRDA